MKPYSILLLLCMCLQGSAWAQPGPPRENTERLESLRIAYLTERLSLTPEESKQFWPIQSAHESEMEAMRDAMKMEKESFDATQASQREILAFVEKMAEQRKAMIDFETSHLIAVADVLGAERALKLPELQRELARRIRERMGAAQKKGGHGPRQQGRRQAPNRSRLH